MTMNTASEAPVLTPEQRDDLGRILRSERRRLERMIAARGSDEAWPADLPTRLAIVIDAIERFDAGRYGVCVRCEGAIPYGRLVVLPESDHCLACGTA